MKYGSKAQRVLIVDDQRPVHDVIGLAFSADYPYIELLHCYSGREALAQDFDSIGVVLTDIAMPNMDGQELMQALRERCGDIPVFTMSGYAYEGAIITTKLMGAKNHFEKPFRDIGEVARSIVEFIKTA